MLVDLRSFCIAELGSFDLNASVPRLGLIADLGSDVLSLSIAIGPDKQRLAVPGLVPNVLCNRQFVLQEHISNPV